MMLSDMGAEVLRLDRADAVGAKHERDPRFEILNRGRSSVALDLKKPEAIATVLRLVKQADVLIEGFRPGVMERLTWACRLCRGQCQTGVRTHDGLGPGRSAGAAPVTTSTTSP